MSNIKMNRSSKTEYCDICQKETVWLKVAVSIKPVFVEGWRCDKESLHSAKLAYRNEVSA